MENSKFSQLYQRYISPPSGSLKKYRSLILLIAACLVLTVSMLIVNVWITNQMVKHSRVVETAAQQNILIQQISNNIADVDAQLRDVFESQNRADLMLASQPVSQNIKQKIDEIQQNAVKFDHNLTAFENGGLVQTAEGMMIHIPKTDVGQVSHQQIAKIRADWADFHRAIGQFMLDYQAGKIKYQNLHAMADVSRRLHSSLLNAGNEHIFALYTEMNQRANQWQTLQMGAIVLAVLLFGMIIFGAMRRLINDDSALTNENSELSEIMLAIREGLFLIEKDFTIGNQHSAPLETMLEQTELGGKNFLDVVAKMLPESELENTKMFIEQLYNPWVVEELIEDLNPLHRIVMTSEKNNALKYLDFKFFRVIKDERVVRILVSVIDSTENVLLQSSLEAQEEQEQRELEMLNTILHVDSRVLNNFIHSSQERLDEINEILQSPESGVQELKAKANFIGRNVHALKGESSAMNLQRMVDICSTIEDSLAMLRRQSNLSGQDFFSIIVLIDDLYRLLDILDDYSRRIDTAGTHTEQSDEGQAESQQLQNFVQDIAERNDKKASLMVQGLHDYAMDAPQREGLRQIVKQLLRNAVVHGIEYPSVRRQRNKSETGSLKLVLTATADGNLNLLMEDNGNGIDFEAIRSKAVSEGRYSPDEVAQLSKKQLLDLMLSDGFSTASDATDDAGKGLGMGVVRQAVQKMGGKLNINTAYQQYTRFNITFPPQQP